MGMTKWSTSLNSIKSDFRPGLKYQLTSRMCSKVFIF